MSRIFISHSSANNAEAIALRDWLVSEGWSDLFLDLDPNRGIAAGERWERALNVAALRCEAVIFLISKAWLGSRWCSNELTLARRLNKRLFGVLVEEGLSVADLPHDVTSTWQLVNLATGRDHQQFRVSLPVTGAEEHVTYSLEGLSRLKGGLQRAGLHASYFNWPPETDPKRSPYRGLRPLEGDDAGIFFGREAPVIEAIDRLRGLTEAAPPRLMVVLGASGAGKSSFLRAGLLPRLGRDPQTFLPLPVIRPERAALTGETGLIKALADAFGAARLKLPRGDIRDAIAGGAATLKPLLTRLQDAAMLPPINGGAMLKPATLVIAIDQGEELFLAEVQSEAQPFLALLRDVLLTDSPAVIAVFTIRSDNYERLQTAPELEGVHQQMLNLPPMPKGSYAEVVKGPIRRLDGTGRAIRIDDALVDALLADIEAGGAKDSLPLLAFTLERLHDEYSATGHLALDHYVKLGRVKGSIEAAVERAFNAADNDGRIPRDREARLTLLRRGLIPWLAGIDPDTKAPRRRVARLSEIPAEARPLIDLLVEQRLLSTDVAQDTGETTIEPAHEALLRQWGLLHGWLQEDFATLATLDGIRRASRDWAANAMADAWLTHSAGRLEDAERVIAREDLGRAVGGTERTYLRTCRERQLTLAAAATARIRLERRSRIFRMTSAPIVICAAIWLAFYLNEIFGWFQGYSFGQQATAIEAELFDAVCQNLPAQCKKTVSVSGETGWVVRQAEIRATETWQRTVRAQYGTRFQNLYDALGIRIGCFPSSGGVLGTLSIRCTISAQPCAEGTRPHYPKQLLSDSKLCSDSTNVDANIACTNVLSVGNLTACDRSHAYFYRGLALANKGAFDLSITDYTEALKLNTNRDVFRARALAFRASGHPNEAIADEDRYLQSDGDISRYSTAIGFAPDDAENYYERGLAFARLGEHNRAMADYAKAVELNPHYADARHERGLIYLNAKEYDEAIAEFTKAISIEPRSATYYRDRARAYYSAGRAADGLPDAERSLELRANYAEALDIRGNILSALGRREEAIADFLNALGRDPTLQSSKVALSNLGVGPQIEKKGENTSTSLVSSGSIEWLNLFAFLSPWAVMALIGMLGVIAGKRRTKVFTDTLLFMSGLIISGLIATALAEDIVEGRLWALVVFALPGGILLVGASRFLPVIDLAIGVVGAITLMLVMAILADGSTAPLLVDHLLAWVWFGGILGFVLPNCIRKSLGIIR